MTANGFNKVFAKVHLVSQELAALSQLLDLADQLDVRRIVARFTFEERGPVNNSKREVVPMNQSQQQQQQLEVHRIIARFTFEVISM